MVKKTFNISYTARDFFFDRKAVIDAIGRAEAKSFKEIGFAIRDIVRQRVLRKRRRTSQPGEAPSVHSSDRIATLRNVLFAFDPGERELVVGPVKLNQVNMTLSGSQTVPQILEFGGSIIIHEEQYANSKNRKDWFRRDFRVSLRPDKNYRTRMVTIQARPFMQKSLNMAIERGIIRNAWRASIVGR